MYDEILFFFRNVQKQNLHQTRYNLFSFLNIYKYTYIRNDFD